MPGQFELGHIFPREIDNVFFGHTVMTALFLDERARALAPLFVRLGDHRGEQHSRVFG